jgi:tRNA modification GTPase
VGIVRVSGPDAIRIVDKVFLSRSGRPLREQPGFTMRLGWIVPDAARRGTAAGPPHDAVDEVLVSVMRAPQSYTREDVVEVSAHGGGSACAAILRSVLANGARLAAPGEFTRRAFLNGRIDLTQAEAVLDVIRAKGEWALKNSEHQLLGELARAFADVRGGLVGVLADMEAALDFPEEETGATDPGRFVQALTQTGRALDLHLERSRGGRLMREGLKAVLAGRPNVGKSSLLNALLRHERAIVTPVPGTTRDTVEETVFIRGLAVHLIDTAGMIVARDAVEEEALERCRRAVAQADIVLFVLDGSAALTDADREVFASLEDRPRLLLINKSDLPGAWDPRDVRGWAPAGALEVSAKTGVGIQELEDAVLKSAFGAPPVWEEGAWVANARHIEALRRSRMGVGRAIETLEKGLGLDIAALEVRAAAQEIGTITGEVCTEEVLDEIFAKFCIGK